MKKVIVIRAGGNAWEESCCEHEDRRLQGTLPLPLSKAGEKKLRQLCSELREEQTCPESQLEYVYSSGNESSGPTAEYLAEVCGFKTRENKSLCEMDCGLWQGLRIAEIKKRYGRAYRQWRSDPTSVCPPQGEAVQDVYERVKEALVAIDKKNRDKTVVVIAGQIVTALIECVLTECGIERLWQITDDQAPMRVFERSKSGVWVACVPKQSDEGPIDKSCVKCSPGQSKDNVELRTKAI